MWLYFGYILEVEFMGFFVGVDVGLREGLARSIGFCEDLKMFWEGLEEVDIGEILG